MFKANWKACKIKPNFLNSKNHTEGIEVTALPYFENCGRDVALAFVYEEECCMLLSNGYN